MLADPGRKARSLLLPLVLAFASQLPALAQCSYTVGPGSTVIPASGGQAPFSVTTTAFCPWSVTTGAAWLSANPPNFVGSGATVVTAQPNTGPQRNATVTIAGRPVSITQLSGCQYTLSATQVNAPAGGGQSSINVTTGAGCTFTSTSNAAWITVNQQSNSVALTYAANTGPARSGTVTIAGQTVTINQSSGCTFTLSATAFNLPASGVPISVGFTAAPGCVPSATSNASWIQLSVLATSVTITYAPNTGPNRSGTVTIAGQTVTFNQAGNCTFTVTPTSISAPAGGGNYQIVVIPAAGCTWTAATSGVPWIGSVVVTANSVAFNIQNNTGPARNAVITVAGQTVTIAQAAAASACTYALAPSPVVVPPGGGQFSVNITAPAGCAYNLSWNGGWFTLVNSSGSSGNGTAVFNATPNLNDGVRDATISLLNQNVSTTVTQASNCTSFSFSPKSIAFGMDGGTTSVNVITSEGCYWEITSPPGWLNMGGVASGTGPTTLPMTSVAIEGGGSPGSNINLRRSGNIVDTLTVSLASCRYSILGSAEIDVPAPQSEFDATLATTPSVACRPRFTPGVTWLQLVNTSFGEKSTARLRALANTGPARRGTFIFGGETFAVDQVAAGSCPTTVTPSRATAPATASRLDFRVDANRDCTWRAESTVAWIRILTTASATGPADFTAEFAANNTGASRVGVIRVGELRVEVSQSAASTCTYTFSQNSISIGLGGDNASVNVQTQADCPRNPTPSETWLTASPSGPSTGSGSIQISVSPSSAPRSANIRLGTATLSVNQVSCNFTANPSILNVAAAGGPVSVNFTRSLELGCSIVPQIEVPWVTLNRLQVPELPTSPALVEFSVAPNPGPVRSTSVRISGVPVSIQQASNEPCAYGVTPAFIPLGPGAASIAVQVTTAQLCPWTAQLNNPWITFSSTPSSTSIQGSGPRSLGLNIAAFSGATRTGTVSIAGRTVTIVQSSCTYSTNVSNPGVTIGELGGLAYLNFLISNPTEGCSPSTSASVPWITLLLPENTGQGQFRGRIAVAPNSGPERSTIVNFGGVPYNIRQIPCSYQIPTAPIPVPAAGGTASIPLNPATLNGCNPTRQTTTPWITLDFVVDGSLRFLAAPNTGAPRTGSITIAGTSVTIQQAGACSFTVTPNTPQSLPATQTNLSFNVQTESYCAWTASANQPWLTILSGASGTGNGSATVRAAANDAASRSAILSIAGTSIPISQAAGAGNSCTYAINPATANFGQPGGPGSFTLTGTPANCQGNWQATETSDWISLAAPTNGSGPGPFTLNYTVASNPSAAIRTASLAVGGASHNVTQSALAGTPTVEPSLLTFLATIGGPVPNPQSLQLSLGNSAADLQVTSNAPWLSILPGRVRAPASVLIAVQPGTLAVGTYRTTLNVAVAGSTQSVTVPVELRLLAASSSVLPQPSVFRFRWRTGTSVPTAQLLTLFSRPAAQAFTAPQGVPAWLRITAEGETSPLAYSLRVAPETLAPQTEPYRATLSFPLRNAADARAEVLVELFVEPASPGKLSLPSREFILDASPARANRSIEIALANIGGSTLPYRVLPPSRGLLNIQSGGEGQIAPGRRAWLVASLDSDSLRPGSHTEVLTILPEGGDPVEVTITILVPSPPTVLSLSRATMVFKATANDRELESESLFIRNAGSGAMPWTLTVEQSNPLPVWLRVATGNDRGAASPQSEVGVLVNPTGLAQGRHQGLLRVRAPGAANPEQSVLVILDIAPETETSAADISPSALAAAAIQGGSALNQNLTLRNRRAQVLNYIATFSTHSGGNWLSGDRQGTVPASGVSSLRLTMSPGSNGAGVYRGAVRLDFGRGVIEQINVAMIVSPSGTVLPRATDDLTPRSADCTRSSAIAVLSSEGLTGILRAGTPVPLAVQVRDNCGQTLDSRALLGQGIQASIANGPLIPLEPQSGGWWRGEWTPPAGGIQETEIQTVIEGQEDSAAAGPGLRVAWSSPASTASDGPALAAVLNAASFTGNYRITPGSLITLFGTNLAAREEAIGSTVPFELAGTRVWLGERRLPLFYAGPGQINAALPYDLLPGQQTQLRVERGSTSSAPSTLAIESTAPGIFIQNFPGRLQGAVLVAGSVFVAGPTSLGNGYRPIRPGEFLQIFATGLGPVTNAPALGALAGVPLSLVEGTVRILLGGRELTPVFAGLAPGFIGLYQLNVEVPQDLAPGAETSLQLRVGGILSNEVKVAIE